MEAVNGVSEVDKGGPPAPSPLTGCYLLVVVGEPHSKEHKDIILRRIAKGLLSWDATDCHVDLEKELAIITEQAPEGEDARYGERLIQFASENLVTEILIHPAISTLSQCMKNLLSSFTRHRHIIHAGYTFAANGSWILQDGTFSLTDFSEAFQEMEVQRVLRAYDNSISLDIHCSPEGDWTRLPKESFTKNCKVRVNPDDVLTSGSPSIVNFLNYISPFLVPTDIEALLESSDVVGNIRFSHPTLYVFPGGQGDAALFGINGFNMLVDGGFARKACFWDFVRHLDRLDAVLLTRLNNSNVNGISAVLRRKRCNTVYPQIGHFFCNIQERKAILSPDGDKDKDPLIVNLLEEGQEIVSNLRQLHLQPQACYRDIEPINLYHKVGHGTLDMYVLSPAKESKEVREFIQKWNTNDQRLFANQRNGRDFTFPTQNLVSICALLVWQPANANDSITRILFPGSTPQQKIFEGLDRLKQLECIKYPACSAKTLTPSLIKSKQAKVERLIQQDQKENKAREKLAHQAESKIKTENKIAEENIKNIQSNGVTTDQLITQKLIKKHDSTESEKSGPHSGEVKKPDEGKELTNLTNGKPTEEKVEKAKPRAKPEQKPKVDTKVYKHTRSIERKPKPPVEKKASPTTPKKTLDTKINGDAAAKSKPSTKVSPSATPAKSAKEANNRKVVESKYKVAPKKDISKPEKKEVKPERKPISRRPKEISPLGKGPESPVKKLNELHKVEARKSKLEKEGTTDSSTVSTPSADVDTAMKKDISKLTPEELEQLKARELAELKEEQEVVKEIEAVFRKSERKDTDDSDLRKVKNISVDEKTDGEGEEYLIIEKEEIEHDSLDEKETKESETQKHLRDSEESEKQRKLSGEVAVEAKDTKEEKSAEVPDLEESVKVNDNQVTPPTVDIAKVKEEKEQPKEMSKEVSAISPDEKVDVSSGKKATDRDLDEENKDGNVLESQPDEKFSTPIESGATTAPTLPEDERIPLDEIKEDNGDQVIEEKYVKEDTKEKEIPLVQLPPKTTEAVAKLPTVVGIRLDKQTPIRDLVKTPDEVADLPVHEEVDIENYEHYQATQSQTPKQEEMKQINAAKKAKLEKTEKEPLTKPEEKVTAEGEEKEHDKKIEVTEKITEDKQKELTKTVDEKDILVTSEAVKETPIKVAEIETIQAGEKTSVEEKHPEKVHEEEKADLGKEKIEKTVDKLHEEKQDVEKAEVKVEQVKEDVVKVKDDKVVETEGEEVEKVVAKADVEKKEEENLKETQGIGKVDMEKPVQKDEVGKVEAEKEDREKVEIGKPVQEDQVVKVEIETADADVKEVKVENEASEVDIGKKEVEKVTKKDGVGKPEIEEAAEHDVGKVEAEKPTDTDVKEVKVEKEAAEVVTAKNEVDRDIEKEDGGKSEIEKAAAKIEAEKAADVDEQEVKVEKETAETDTEKKEVEKLITKDNGKSEIEPAADKVDASKADVDVKGVKVEKEAEEVAIGKEELEKISKEDDIGKSEIEKASEKDVGKTEEEKTIEVGVDKAEIVKSTPKVDIGKEELQKDTGKEDAEILEEKSEVKEVETERTGEMAKAELEKPALKDGVEIEEIAKITEKDAVKTSGIEKLVEKMEAPKVEAEKLIEEIDTSKIKVEEAEMKIDEVEKKKEEEEVAEKEDLEKAEKVGAQIVEGAIAAKEEHAEKVETERTKDVDVKEAKSEKVECQEKGTLETTKEVKDQDQDHDDVEAKIVAIEKELVAVITEEVKEIEKLEEKADKPEKDKKIEEAEKVSTEKVTAEDVKEVKTQEVEDIKQEKSDGANISGEHKEIKVADGVHSEVIKEDSAVKTEEKDKKLDKDVEELKEGEKKEAEEVEEKTEGISVTALKEMHEEKMKTTEVRDLKAATEMRVDEIGVDLKDVEGIDKKITEPEKTDLKDKDDKVAEKIFDVIPDLKFEEHTEKIEKVSIKVTEIIDETPAAAKEAVKEEVKTEQHKDESKQAVEEDKKASEETILKTDVEKADEKDDVANNLKDSKKEKLEDGIKSDAEKIVEKEISITDATEVTKDKIARDDIKSDDKGEHIKLDQKLEKSEDKVVDVIDTILDSCEKIEETKESVKAGKTVDEKEKAVEQKETAEEKIDLKDIKTLETDKELHDILLIDAEKAEEKVETAVKDSGLIKGELSKLDSKTSEPKAEDKPETEKKEPLSEGKITSKEVATESAEKHSEKDVEDIKEIEQIDKPEIKKESDDVKLHKEEFDKEKSTVEQKEEDTGKLDKTVEIVDVKPSLSEKPDQKGETKESKTEKDEIKSIDVKEDKKADEEKKEADKDLDKKEQISPIPQDSEKLNKKSEIEILQGETTVEFPQTKVDKIEELAKDEKKDESKEEKLFKGEEKSMKDVQSVSSDKPVETEAKEGEIIKKEAEIKTAEEVVKEIAEASEKADAEETSDDIESKDQEKGEASEDKKVLEKVEEVPLVKVEEMKTKLEEDRETEKKTGPLVEPKIEETVLKTAADLAESLVKMDDSVKEKEVETDFKVSKSDVTKLAEDDKSVIAGYVEKHAELQQISTSEKLDKAPSLEPSKPEEKTGKQGEKDYTEESRDKTAIKSVHADSVEISKIDKKLQELKETTDSEAVELDSSIKSQSKNEIDVVDKIELGRKSPKEREQDVAIIVASVAEVLKSDAPLEEFEGKIPLEITAIPPYPPYSTELRETHITTVESPIREDIITDKIQMHPIEEEKSSPRDSISVFLDEERKIAPLHSDYDDLQKEESRVSSLLKDSTELIQATSKIISDIKQSSKVDDDVVSVDIKETQKILETPVTIKDLPVESKEQVLEKLIPVDEHKKSSPHTVDDKKEPLHDKEGPLDTKECDIKVDPSLAARKSTPDIKEQVHEALDVDKPQSGKLSTEIKEPLKETADVNKSLISSGEVSPDSKESVKEALDIDKSPITSGKTTPDLKPDITGVQSLEKSASGKTTPDIKTQELATSGKTSPIKLSDIGVSKPMTVSGKLSPDIKETNTDLVASGKPTPEIQSKINVDEVIGTSGKTTPEIKEPVIDVSKDVAESEKVTSDVKDAVKSSLDTTSVISGKSTPEIKEPDTDLSKSLVSSDKLTSDIKESVKSSLEATPVASGKTTPEIIEPTVHTDVISSGKTSSEILDKSTITGKATSEEPIKDALATDKSSIISGKSTPEIVEPVKDTLDTSKSPILSGKSTPDIVIDQHESCVDSGRSTPDIEVAADKCLDDSAKCSADKTDILPTTSVPIQSATPIDADKKSSESEKHSTEVKESDTCALKSEILALDTKQSTVEVSSEKPVSEAGKAVGDVTDISKALQTTEKSSTDVTKSPLSSGKMTPDLQHSIRNGLDQIQSPVDSRKSSLKELIDIDKTSSASGKSTPELKEPTSVISGRTTPDTKVSVEKDIVKPEISTCEVKSISEPAISDPKAKIESIAGPSSSSKDGRSSPSKSPTEELDYSRKSTPDIADVAKSKDLEEPSSGKTTPPTVPVSPIVKEKHPVLHEQEKGDKKDVPEVFALKITEARSSTPASDDCDISSGQVSRVLTTEEDDEKQVYSDDEDLPGSPLSATSQVAHSTSSQYDFEDSVRGVGPIDPMSTSFYGALPDDPVDLSKGAKTSRFLDEADLDFDRALHEHRQTRGEDLTSGVSPSYVYELTTAKYSSIKLQEETQTQATAATAPATLQKESVMTSSFIGTELPTDPKDDPIASWGKPLGLPSPAPLNDNKGTPKKERKIPPNVMAKNKLNEDKKLSDSKYDRRGKKINPIYVDLTYVPHHGNSNYSYVDFFKRVRARYYVFSGIEPSKEVYNALLEAKQTWDDKELEVTIIPTYDTDVLGYWVAENEDLLAKYKIDLSPSASRCTINLQDHETSCSAYRLEFS